MKAPVRPNLDSFRELTAAFSVRGYWEKVDYYLWRIGRKQLFMDRKLYADVLYGFAKNGAHDRIEKTLYKMRKEQLEPELDAFNAILKGYAEVGNVKYVNRTFDELRFKLFDVTSEVPTTPGQFERPDATTFHLILSGYKSNKLYQQGVEIFRFMRGRKIQPLPETIPIIQEFLDVTGSKLPIDVYEEDDVFSRSKYLRDVHHDTVSHESPFRSFIDISLPRFRLAPIPDPQLNRQTQQNKE